MTEPTLALFSLSDAEYQLCSRLDEKTIPAVAGAVLACGGLSGAIFGFLADELGVITLVAVPMFAAAGFAYAFIPALLLFSTWKIVVSWFNPAVQKYSRFVKARDEYRIWERRTQVAFWRSLSGIAFERELAAAFRRVGYHAVLTPVSGDKGIDIVLSRDEQPTIVVQCKATAKPVGPAVVRELYGTLLACGADRAVLAATGGVSAAARDFAQGKPIQLVTMPEILSLHAGHDPLTCIPITIA